MSPIAGASREQPGLFPEVLAGDMAEESPVRCIEAFVASLDLDALGFRRVPPAATGRPAYPPGDLLTRYSDGDRHRIRSGRRLGQATRRNMAPRWLLRPRHPDFETIAAFRQDDVRAFKQVFRVLTVLCKEGGLCGPELVAIDGRKFKAVSSKRRDFTAATRHETRHAIDAKLEQYLHALDATEAAEAEVPQPTVETRRGRIRHLRGRKGRSEQLRDALEASGERQVSLTDPDSRAMPKSPTVAGGDNVQTAGDAQHERIVEPHVAEAVTDVGQLSALARTATEALGVEPPKVVAEAGHSRGEGIKACEEAGIEPSIAKPWTSANRKWGRYGQERFTYDPVHDGSRGPAGPALTCRCTPVERGRQLRYDATTACRPCAINVHRTRHKGGGEFPAGGLSTAWSRGRKASRRIRG